MSRFDVPEQTEEQCAQDRVVATFAQLIDRVVGRERGARFEWSYAIRESFSEDAKVVTIVLEEHGGRTLAWNLWVTDREIMRELRSTGKYVLADRTIEAANALAWRFYEPSFRIGRRLRGQRR